MSETLFTIEPESQSDQEPQLSDDDFLLHVANQLNGLHFVQNKVDGAFFIVGGYNYRQGRTHGVRLARGVSAPLIAAVF